MGYGRKLYERCSRQGDIGICDLPVHHTGECMMIEFSSRSDKRVNVPIDKQLTDDR